MSKPRSSRRRRILFRAGVGLGGGFLLLAAILLCNAATVGSSIRETPPAPPIPHVDEAQAAAQLGALIRHPTIAPAPGDPGRPEAFAAMGQELERLYPRVHAAMSLSTVGLASRVYRWSGSDPSLPPVLLLAHLDVVPIEPGTEDEWEQPPFSGTIDGGFLWGRGSIDVKLGSCRDSRGLRAAARRRVRAPANDRPCFRSRRRTRRWAGSRCHRA